MATFDDQDDPDTSFTNADTIRFEGALKFAADEEVFLHTVGLFALGPGGTDLAVSLPLQSVTAFDLTNEVGVTGDLLKVTVGFTNLVLPGGTLPGFPEDTLPLGTLPEGVLAELSDACVGFPLSAEDLLSGDTLPGTLPVGTLPGFLPGGVPFPSVTCSPVDSSRG